MKDFLTNLKQKLKHAEEIGDDFQQETIVALIEAYNVGFASACTCEPEYKRCEESYTRGYAHGVDQADLDNYNKQNKNMKV